MGHLVGKDIYKSLGAKIDSLNVKTPWNKTFHNVLKELYSEAEADLVVKMPSLLSTLKELEACTGLPGTQLRILLEKLCSKGLVVDIFVNNDFYYMPSPLVIGVFEFTMMRMDKDLDIKKISRLFHNYLDDDTFYKANFGAGQRMGLMRTLPYEESFTKEGLPADYVEILDYEKATAVVEQADIFSIGACSCRHEKLHAGEKKCDVPLNTCSSFGYSADYLIRNKLAKKVSKAEMLETVARSKELGLVINTDNVKNNSQFICHCCKCCCNVLLGISKFGYPNTVVTSSFIIELDEKKCVGCGKCIKACGVEAIAFRENSAAENYASKNKKKEIAINKSICLGCGVCVMKCNPGALSLVKKKQRVLHPESTFEHAILKSIEKGNLQDQVFANPGNFGEKLMRGLLGGFLRLPPVKRALMSNTLRSSFLKIVEKAARAQGKGWLIDL
ncbi:MAG: 4Fe-4S dicluster domain-containing protein [bacterium]|nr:4Fe-4S dicluster domain-containing protein [bacterium]